MRPPTERAMTERRRSAATYLPSAIANRMILGYKGLSNEPGS
jgi:hypothetical protein